MARVVHPFDIKAVMLDIPDLLPNFMCVMVIIACTFAHSSESLSHVVLVMKNVRRRSFSIEQVHKL